jgi:hypothetical protein
MFALNGPLIALSFLALMGGGYLFVIEWARIRRLKQAIQQSGVPNFKETWENTPQKAPIGWLEPT